jgi:hypothetical protein
MLHQGHGPVRACRRRRTIQARAGHAEFTTLRNRSLPLDLLGTGKEDRPDRIPRRQPAGIEPERREIMPPLMTMPRRDSTAGRRRKGHPERGDLRRARRATGDMCLGSRGHAARRHGDDIARRGGCGLAGYGSRGSLGATMHATTAERDHATKQPLCDSPGFWTQAQDLPPFRRTHHAVLAFLLIDVPQPPNGWDSGSRRRKSTANAWDSDSGGRSSGHGTRAQRSWDSGSPTGGSLPNAWDSDSPRNPTEEKGGMNNTSR